jgi:hypothetical protein
VVELGGGGNKKRKHHSCKINLGRWSLGTPIWRCNFNVKISALFTTNLTVEWILNIRLMKSKHTLDEI